MTEALRRRGWSVDLRDRTTPVADAADDVDLLVLAVPDGAIASVAAAVHPRPDTVVLHLSGARGLDVLRPHRRRASLHPLMSLPDPVIGADRLLDDCVFAVAGDPLARCLVEQFGGRALSVPDEQRALYHATASVAANHLVALAAQVERLAAAAGLPADAYWPLMRTTLDNIESLGARGALTGPAARGDTATISAHLDAMPAGERPLYVALAAAAARLAGTDLGPMCHDGDRERGASGDGNREATGGDALERSDGIGSGDDLSAGSDGFGGGDRRGQDAAARSDGKVAS